MILDRRLSCTEEVARSGEVVSCQLSVTEIIDSQFGLRPLNC
jgi:hypothetical protein